MFTAILIAAVVVVLAVLESVDHASGGAVCRLFLKP